MPQTSQVVHGLSIPLGKFGYHLPRTLSDLPRTLSGAVGDANNLRPSRSREAVTNEEGRLEAGRTRRIIIAGDVDRTEKQDGVGISAPLKVRRIGGTIIEGT